MHEIKLFAHILHQFQRHINPVLSLWNRIRPLLHSKPIQQADRRKKKKKDMTLERESKRVLHREREEGPEEVSMPRGETRRGDRRSREWRSSSR